MRWSKSPSRAEEKKRKKKKKKKRRKKRNVRGWPWSPPMTHWKGQWPKKKKQKVLGFSLGGG